MAQTPKDHHKEVNVEDLLHLKRCERPGEAFWGKFDGELHQRMLQTLVKKDPWYLQLMRGLSGRLAQSVAVASAAAFIGLLVVRSAFVGTVSSEGTRVAENEVVANPSDAPNAVVLADPATVEAGATSAGVRDYGIEAISVREVARDSSIKHDFGMDSIQLASYDSSSYSADTAMSRVALGSTGVASLIY